MKIFALLILLGLLAACSSTQDSKTFHVETQRDQLRPAAQAGDADAQYQLGQSWCCSERNGFFSTQEAEKWWCAAARQGHARAIQALRGLGDAAYARCFTPQ